jgi:hypothetical protein
VSFTFDPSLADAISRIRFDLGDTAEPAFVEDETITAMVAGAPDEREATVKLASALIVRFAQEPDRVELADGEGAVTWSARLRGWQALISRLQAEKAAAVREAGTGFRVLSPSRALERAEYRRDGRCDW